MVYSFWTSVWGPQKACKGYRNLHIQGAPGCSFPSTCKPGTVHAPERRPYFFRSKKHPTFTTKVYLQINISTDLSTKWWFLTSPNFLFEKNNIKLCFVKKTIPNTKKLLNIQLTSSSVVENKSFFHLRHVSGAQDNEALSFDAAHRAAGFLPHAAWESTLTGTHMGNLGQAKKENMFGTSNLDEWFVDNFVPNYQSTIINYMWLLQYWFKIISHVGQDLTGAMYICFAPFENRNRARPFRHMSPLV